MGSPEIYLAPLQCGRLCSAMGNCYSGTQWRCCDRGSAPGSCTPSAELREQLARIAGQLETAERQLDALIAELSVRLSALATPSDARPPPPPPPPPPSPTD